jgi:hypothetical protein
MSESSRMGPCPSLGAFYPGHGTISQCWAPVWAPVSGASPGQYDLDSARQPRNKERETRSARVNSSIADCDKNLRLLSDRVWRQERMRLEKKQVVWCCSKWKSALSELGSLCFMFSRTGRASGRGFLRPVMVPAQCPGQHDGSSCRLAQAVLQASTPPGCSQHQM